MKISEKCPKFYRFKLKTGLARDFLFVSSASKVCELKNLPLDKIRFWNQVVMKNMPACQFWPILRCKTVNSSWTKNILISLTRYWRKKTTDWLTDWLRKCAKSQDQGISRSKVKGSVEWSRHVRHFCSLLPYYLLSWLQIFQLFLSFWTSSFDMVLFLKFLQEKEKYPKNFPKRLSS